MPRAALSSFNLNLLVALDALLGERSVSLAAKRTAVTPSAMSHSLSELRELLGDPLLVRSGRAMVLSPRAEGLVEPLHRLLLDARRLLHQGDGFDPSSSKRHFVIAAPDFLGTVVMASLHQKTQHSARGVTFELVPSARRGNAWRLETGEIDLALGAVVDGAPGIRHMHLCTERFVCAVRRGHPEVDRALTLEQYVRIPHLVITLGDDTSPTWIDEALAKLGYRRQVASRVRYFMAAPLLLAQTDLLMTGPEMLVRHFAELLPLRVFEPPIPLPTYSEQALWHHRFEGDPAHLWLRELVRDATASLGTGTAPERTAWRPE